MPVTSSPTADGRAEPRAGLRAPVPRSFQTRLGIAFVGIVALTLALVAPLIINRLDDHFRQQEQAALRARAVATANVLGQFVSDAVGTEAVVAPSGSGMLLNPRVRRLLVDEGRLALVANNVAQADVSARFGAAVPDTDGVLVPQPEDALAFAAPLTSPPARGQARDPSVAPARGEFAGAHGQGDWGISVTLANPYTSRASTLTAITGLLLALAAIVLPVAMLVAAFIARRFTSPLTRLTDVSRRLADGDLASRVPPDEVSSSTLELRELSTQFNLMAARLQESVEIIRRERDRGRDFLADVSHELRTPIAAMRTFVELLQGPAGADPAARTEFLDSSAVQLDRLDWLAQNLLELSKLDSGLVLLDLRPDDLRATIESAVHQALPAAERKGIVLRTSLPDRPLRIQHDAPRVAQVVGNLVGNALKFTNRGGSVQVLAHAEADGGARIEVVDTGVGIDATELPRIFERFYRGAEANEARSAGSGLGLAIVKSIVDMHHGGVAVESRVGHGSRFVVTLPRDPSAVAEIPAGPATAADGSPAAPAVGPPRPTPGAEPAAERKMVDSSPGDPPVLNAGHAP